MAASSLRRRWGRRAIVLLVVLNAALWAAFVFSGGNARVGASRAAARSSAHAAH